MAPPPKLHLDRTREPLITLGLSHAAEQLDTLLSQAVKASASPHEVIDSLMQAEMSAREARRIKTALPALGCCSSGYMSVKPMRAWSSMATNKLSQPAPATQSRRLPVTRRPGRSIRPSFLRSRCSKSPGASCS
jgi:hypothetical protein